MRNKNCSTCRWKELDPYIPCRLVGKDKCYEPIGCLTVTDEEVFPPSCPQCKNYTLSQWDYCMRCRFNGLTGGTSYFEPSGILVIKEEEAMPDVDLCVHCKHFFLPALREPCTKCNWVSSGYTSYFEESYVLIVREEQKL